MFNDVGFIALLIILALWIGLVILGLLVGLMPGKWKQKPQRKRPGQIPSRSHG